MNAKSIIAFAVVTVVTGAITMAHAQQAPAESVDIGKYEYESYCAICHGSKGTGLDREPYWSLLSKNIPNLTMLSNANGGVFPFIRVYETIDGRQVVMAHGSRDMPIWGREFSARALSLSPFYDSEAFARAKILALTEYVYRLQAK